MILDVEAKAYDLASPLGSEFERRMRTLAGLWQDLARRPELLGFRDRMWLHFVSHKVGRLLLPWLALAALASAFWLPSPWREAVLAAAVAFLALAAFDSILPQGSLAEANHLAGTDHPGDAGRVLLLHFGVSSIAPALVEANQGGSGDTGRLVRWLLAPELLNRRDVLESQPVIYANTQALVLALGLTALHASQKDRLAGLKLDKSTTGDKRSTVRHFKFSPVRAGGNHIGVSLDAFGLA